MKNDMTIRKKCSECKNLYVTGGSVFYNCDQCGKLIPEELLRLEVTVFKHKGEAEGFEFDSWNCFSHFIQDFKFGENDHFISLPFVHNAENFAEFIDILKYSLE